MTSFVGSDIWATCFGFPAGQPLGVGGAGAVAFWITAVGTDVAEFSPSPFFAITRNRIVFPTSTARSVYVFENAPLIVAQFPPFGPQRSHR
jgi:hypothetical protein